MDKSLPPGYHLERDTDILALHRPDGSLLGAFSTRGVREEAVLRTVEDDRQGYPIYNGPEAYAGPVRRLVRNHMNCQWEKFLRREKRWLGRRRSGQLARTLVRALPTESREEIDRIALEDRRRAEKGLVELRSEEGRLFYKHIDDLLPEDRQARIRAELARIEWLLERQQRRNQLFRQGMPESRKSSREKQPALRLLRLQESTGRGRPEVLTYLYLSYALPIKTPDANTSAPPKTT